MPNNEDQDRRGQRRTCMCALTIGCGQCGCEQSERQDPPLVSFTANVPGWVQNELRDLLRGADQGRNPAVLVAGGHAFLKRVLRDPIRARSREVQPRFLGMFAKAVDLDEWGQLRALCDDGRLTSSFKEAAITLREIAGKAAGYEVPTADEAKRFVRLIELIVRVCLEAGAEAGHRS